MLYPKYHLYISNRDIYLATSKKLALQKTSKYIFNLTRNESSKKVASYLGKLRSNFMGTEFMVYDNGLSPEVTQNPDQLRS